MKTMKVTLLSESPLLMNSNKGVDPTHPLTKALKAITSKMKRSDADEMEILKLKWLLGLYYDKTSGVHIPAINIEGVIRDAAKQVKEGSKVKVAVRVDPDYIPLEYDGPKTPEELWDDPRFRDVRVGKLQGKSSILICRPRFDHWKLTCIISYEDTVFSQEKIMGFLEYGGKFGGVGDYRQRYGKFTPVLET